MIGETARKWFAAREARKKTHFFCKRVLLGLYKRKK